MTKYLQKIKGNVKNGIPDYIDLTDKTLIWGENGSGKSSIINATELVLGGFATDIMGRPLVRKPADLIVLKGSGLPQSTLQVKGILNDGTTLSYELRKTEKGAGRPKHLGPKGLQVRFPFQEIRDNLTGSAATARQWLARQLPIDQYLKVSSELRSEIHVQQQANPNNSLSDILSAIQELAKRQIKDAKAEIKAREITKELLGKDLQIVSSEDVQSAKEESDRLLQLIMVSSKLIKRDDVKKSLEKGALFDLELQLIKDELAKMDVQPLTQAEETQVQQLIHLRAVCEINETRSDCFVCQGNLDSALSTADVEKVLSSVEARMLAYKEMGAKQQKLENLQREYAKWEQSHEKLMSLFNKQQAEEIDDKIHDKYNFARKHYEDLKSHLENGKRIKALNKEIEMFTKSIDESEIMGKQAEQQASEAIAQAIEAFCEKVNRYLPEQYKFIMEMTESYCRIGLEKYGDRCFAVSGAEWAIMVLAIAAATTYQDDVLSVYVPEERAYDSATLSQLMKALASANGQVILTSTFRPNHIPEGWSEVHCPNIPF